MVTKHSLDAATLENNPCHFLLSRKTIGNKLGDFQSRLLQDCRQNMEKSEFRGYWNFENFYDNRQGSEQHARTFDLIAEDSILGIYLLSWIQLLSENFSQFTV